MSNLTNISKEQFYNIYKQDINSVLIDVRTPMEYQNQHVKDSFNIPLDNISPESIDSFLVEHNRANDESVYLICKSGKRSKIAQQRLEASTRSIICIDGGIDDMTNDNQIQFNQGTSKFISLERQVRITAGVLIVTGFILGASVHPAFYGVTAFVGAGLIVSGITDWCGMGLLMAKMSWNKV